MAMGANYFMRFRRAVCMTACKVKKLITVYACCGCGEVPAPGHHLKPNAEIEPGARGQQRPGRACSPTSADWGSPHGERMFNISPLWRGLALVEIPYMTRPTKPHIKTSPFRSVARSRGQGFTLIELLVVIAIIAILPHCYCLPWLKRSARHIRRIAVPTCGRSDWL